LEDNPLSTYLHIKPNLPLTLVNGCCYGYTPCLEELHNLLTVSGYLEWQENPASKEESRKRWSFPLGAVLSIPPRSL